MEKIILKDGSEIKIHEGAGLSKITTEIESYADLEQLTQKLKTENLVSVQFAQEDRSVTAEYKNMELIGASVQVTVGSNHTVTFGLRERSQEELQQESVQTAISYLSDEQAATVKELHKEWRPDGTYKAGDRRRDEEELYKCLKDHEAQPDWAPHAAPSLWAKILTDPEGKELPWEQPDSTNGYSRGDRVTHNGETWESDVDNNVWEPGTVGTESLWHIVSK